MIANASNQSKLAMKARRGQKVCIIRTLKAFAAFAQVINGPLCLLTLLVELPAAVNG